MKQSETPVGLLQKTSPIDATQTFCALSYTLLREPVAGVLGFVKVIETSASEENIVADFGRFEETNQVAIILIERTGRWIALRKPEDVAQFKKPIHIRPEKPPPEDPIDRLYGEENDKTKDAKMVAEEESFRQRAKEDKVEARKQEIRQKILKELEEKMADPNTIESFCELNYKRINQQRALQQIRADYNAKRKEVSSVLAKTTREIMKRLRKHPDWATQWKEKTKEIMAKFDAKSDDSPIGGSDADLELEAGIAIVEAAEADGTISKEPEPEEVFEGSGKEESPTG